jgi:hypothetical protein
VAEEIGRGSPGDRAAIQAKAGHDNGQMPALPPASRHRAGAGRLQLPRTYPAPRYWD